MVSKQSVFIFTLELLQKEDNSYCLFSFCNLAVTQSHIEWKLDFHCRHWQESPAPSTDICCLTLVNNSHINHVTLPTFYVQAFLLHSSKPNHLQATATYRLINLGPRSATPTSALWDYHPRKLTTCPWGFTPLNSPTGWTMGLVCIS